ncbi:MAG: hypothetical protein ACYS0G_04280 [Planctomycetota bacterium]|jgi:hypothetical protein
MKSSRTAVRARSIGLALLLVALALPAAPARAGDLFEILVTATDGSPTPDLLVGGFELPELLNDLVNAQGAFASFDGVAFSADITFAGVPDAINITVDPVTETATLTFTILGDDAQTFTFTGTDLADQIEQFLENNLANQLTAFLDAINTLALVAVTDGTPLSTTALSATYVFDRFGLHADLTAAERRAMEDQEVEPGLRGRFDTYYESIDTDVGDGDSFAIAPSLEWVFDETTSIAFLFPIAYHDIEGAEILNAHVNLAVPVNVLRPGVDSPLSVRVVPFGTLAGSGSIDMVAGGLIGGGGVVSTATLFLGDLTVSASSQFSYHEGLTLRYEDFEFDPGVSQEIVKVGLKATQTVGDNFYIFGSIVHTTFLEDAAVDDYLTPGGGFGYRLENGLNLNFGYSSDIADGYDSHRLRFTFQLPF